MRSKRSSAPNASALACWSARVFRSGTVKSRCDGHIRQGPRSPCQLIHVLEGQLSVAVRIGQYQPINAVARAAWVRFVSGTVLESEKPAVELCQAPDIGSIQNRLEELGKPVIGEHYRPGRRCAQGGVPAGAGTLQ